MTVSPSMHRPICFQSAAWTNTWTPIHFFRFLPMKPAKNRKIFYALICLCTTMRNRCAPDFPAICLWHRALTTFLRCRHAWPDWLKLIRQTAFPWRFCLTMKKSEAAVKTVPTAISFPILWSVSAMPLIFQEKAFYKALYTVIIFLWTLRTRYTRRTLKNRILHLPCR